jgi:serine/threonine protein kinase/type II secretory pathway pseudopilin PulG
MNHPPQASDAKPDRPGEPTTAPAEALDDPRVAVLVREYQAALEAGQRPDRRELLARHPDLAAALAGCLDALEFFHAAAPQLQPPDLARALEAGGPEPLQPNSLGDYRLVREIGRGGMGVVYEAEQVSLSRRVALKVLPFAAALDGRHLQRFKHEAQAAAHLHHQNIVPVHAVGSERGVHYYAMQLIDGQTLAELIQDLRRRAGLAPGPDGEAAAAPGSPTVAAAAADATVRATGLDPHSSAFFRTAAQLGAQAAAALDYAHEQGIIHRDIKPANLLLDGRGTLWITDFGLARLQSGATLTATGDLVGTLRYMSPEQALGQRGIVDQRTDIYSLGVTLYELLTLEPALNGRDRAELIRQIAMHEPRPPRHVNRAIPAELETIVLKAIAKSPGERYATAQELADDLGRFLKDEPIRARRPTAPQRVRKWARRHPAVVWSAALLLVMAVIGLTAALVAINAARNQTLQAYEELQREQGRTQAALDAEARRRKQAREALDAIWSPLVEDWLTRQPRLLPEHTQFLEGVLKSYEQFAADTGQGPEVRAGVANAHSRVGYIRHLLGQLKEQEAAYERSLELWTGLATDFPSEPTYRRGLAQVRTELGRIWRDTGRTREAEEAFRQAVAVQERLTADFPDVPEYRHDLAQSLYSLGGLLSELRRTRPAEAAYRQALALHRQLAADFPKVPRYRQSLAKDYLCLGELLEPAGRPGEAEEHFRQGRELHERLAAEFPTVAEYRKDLAQAYHDLGSLLVRTGRAPQAEAAYGQALAIYKPLVAEFPTVAEYRSLMALSSYSLGLLLKQLGRGREAEATYRQTLALQKQLAADFPTVPEYRHSLALTQTNLGLLLRDMGRPDEADEALRQALALYRRLVEEFPKSPDRQNELAGALINLARLHFRKAPEVARRLLNEGLPHHQAALQARPQDPVFRRYYRNNRWALIETLLAQGEHPAAAAVVEEFLAVGVDAAQDGFTAACLLARCARVAEKDQRLPAERRQEAAQGYAERAVASLRQAVAKGYKKLEPLKKDRDLEPLRSRPDFQALVASLEKVQ